MKFLRLSSQYFVILVTMLGLSLISSLPQVFALVDGQRTTALEAGIGLRYLRELLTLILYAVIAYHLFVASPPKRISPLLVLTFWALIAISAIATVRTLSLGFPSLVPVSGLRIFQYVPLIFVGHYLATTLHRFHRTFAILLSWYVLSIGAIGVLQVFTAPSLFGETFLGPRAFSVFPAPNIFGITLAACLAWFGVASILERLHDRSERFLTIRAITFLLIVSTGSRTALIVGVLALIGPSLTRLSTIARWIAIALSPVFLTFIYALASTQAFSGRSGTSALYDPRIERVFTSLNLIDGIGDFLLGWGLGLPSNTLNNLVGYGVFEGQIIADSQYLAILGSFGAIGLVIYLIAILNLTLHGDSRSAWLVGPFVFLAGIPYNVLEYFPANALLLLLWGYSTAPQVQTRTNVKS